MPRPSKEDMRDLGLVLVGLSLSKSDRERVLGCIPPGTLCHELDLLLEAVRTSDPREFRSWLAERSAPIEGGKDAVQAMVDGVLGYARRQRTAAIVAELNAAFKLLDPGELAKKLRECADRMEE